MDASDVHRVIRSQRSISHICHDVTLPGTSISDLISNFMVVLKQLHTERCMFGVKKLICHKYLKCIEHL